MGRDIGAVIVGVLSGGIILFAFRQDHFQPDRAAECTSRVKTILCAKFFEPAGPQRGTCVQRTPATMTLPEGKNNKVSFPSIPAPLSRGGDSLSLARRATRGVLIGRSAGRAALVGRTRLNDPLHRLASDLSYAVEVVVIVHHRDPMMLSDRRDQQIRDFHRTVQPTRG